MARFILSWFQHLHHLVENRASIPWEPPGVDRANMKNSTWATSICVLGATRVRTAVGTTKRRIGRFLVATVSSHTLFVM